MTTFLNEQQAVYKGLLQHNVVFLLQEIYFFILHVNLKVISSE